MGYIITLKESFDTGIGSGIDRFSRSINCYWYRAEDNGDGIIYAKTKEDFDLGKERYDNRVCGWVSKANVVAVVPAQIDFPEKVGHLIGAITAEDKTYKIHRGVPYYAEQASEVDGKLEDEYKGYSICYLLSCDQDAGFLRQWPTKIANTAEQDEEAIKLFTKIVSRMNKEAAPKFTHA